MSERQLFDTIKGAFDPTEPLSLEHWLDSAGLAGALYGGYKTGKNALTNAVKPYSVKKRATASITETKKPGDVTYPKASDLKNSQTVQGKMKDLVKKGQNKGEVARPYIDTQGTNMFVDEIMAAGTPVKDVGLENGLRWDVPGSFRGSDGIWELVVDLDSNTIVHFNFTSQ